MQLLLGSNTCLIDLCRGLATYEKGEMPVPMDTIRQVLGCGVRAGIYPISDTEVRHSDLTRFLCHGPLTMTLDSLDTCTRDPSICEHVSLRCHSRVCKRFTPGVATSAYNH